ncbi:hypothetical protein AB0F81_30240 [Actinoplanes sp. NPDC024001]|uniref:hypothetical protein n=1 Tax=Actinoplanes sp. NPDC024001 TaxID=3154598 RepID=UPI0033ED5CF2
MTRPRILLAAGISLLLAAVLLLCAGLAGMADVPYQDPTPQMIAAQAARTAAAERRAAIYAGAAALLAVLGVACLLIRSRLNGSSTR